MIFTKQDEHYIVEVDNGGCIVSDTFNLNVLTNPPILLGNDTLYCQFNYDFITLNAGIGTGYNWLPTLETSRMITVKDPGIYTVTVDYLNGCKKDTSITIKEECPPEFFIPSCFTPNDDGLNDMLCPFGNSYEALKLTIFNRWGEIVFLTTDPSSCWNGMIKGKKAAVDVYAYTISYSGLSQSGQSETIRKTGTVTLIR